MRTILNSLSTKLWLYYSIVILIVFTLVIYYFPEKQKESITKYRSLELTELSRNIAMGVELSLEEDNFRQLDKSMQHYQKRKDEFDFLYLFLGDSLGRDEQLFVQIGIPYEGNPLDDTASYIIANTAVKTKKFIGQLIIGLSKDRVEKEVKENNIPIYIILVTIMLLVIIVFYFLAQKIANPIKNAIKNAQYLQAGEFSNFKKMSFNSQDEIAGLQDALISLKDTLLAQKNENNHLLANLELKILERTESLNETLLKLNEAQAIASLGYFTYHPITNNLVLSPNLLHLLNIPETIPYNFSNLITIIDPDYYELLAENLSTDTEGPFSFELKTNIYDPNEEFNKWILIQGNRRYDSSSNEYHVTGIIQLITSQKKSQGEINKLSLAVRDSSTSIIITDAKQKITWINESVVKLTGYTREEIIGHTPKMFQFEGTSKETIEKIRANLKELKKFKVEIENQDKYGRRYWLELYIQPIINEVGKHEGFMAIEIDISDRKEKEKLINNYIHEIEEKQSEIIQMNRTLSTRVADKTRDLEFTITKLKQSQEEVVKKEKMAVIGVLVSGIAHEINNPLGAIKASVDNLTYLFTDDLLKTIASLSHDDLATVVSLYKEFQELPKFTTLEERKSIKRLSADLQDQFPELSEYTYLARLLVETGITSTNNLIIPVFSRTNMIQIFESLKMLVNIRRSLETINEGAVKSARIIRALGVYSYSSNQNQKMPFKLKESINNVITILWNKLKNKATLTNSIPEDVEINGYEDELSQVWLNIINNALQASLTSFEIQINYENQINSHLITISNNGPKIPKEIIGQIFDEFFTTKKRGEGTGLGLNIVRKIVEKHGGDIYCSSDDNLTTFSIKLPI